MDAIYFGPFRNALFLQYGLERRLSWGSKTHYILEGAEVFFFSEKWKLHPCEGLRGVPRQKWHRNLSSHGEETLKSWKNIRRGLHFCAFRVCGLSKTLTLHLFVLGGIIGAFLCSLFPPTSGRQP